MRLGLQETHITDNYSLQLSAICMWQVHSKLVTMAVCEMESTNNNKQSHKVPQPSQQ